MVTWLFDLKAIVLLNIGSLIARVASVVVR